MSAAPASDLPSSLYRRVGDDRFVPTELTRGPWSPDAQHGGPPAALLAGILEAHDPAGSRITRLTVELLRPVPLTPLDVHVETLRPGRKVQLVTASLLSEGTEVTRATAMRVRTTALTLGDIDPEPVPPVGDQGEFSLGVDQVMFGAAFDIRRMSPFEPTELGPRLMWFRLRCAVIEGEPVMAIQRVAAAADFPNGISSIRGWLDGWIFINPDLTISLARPPEGEWVALDARTVPSDDGVGFAEAALFDERGRIGRSTQSLLFDRPDPVVGDRR